MKIKKGNILILAGLLLIAAALAIVLYNGIESHRAGISAEQIMRVLSDVIEENAADDEDGGAPRGLAEAARPADLREMETVYIDGRYYIGYLEIPSLGLYLPVQSDWSYDALRATPCRYSGSYYTDDLTICGHNYAKHFGSLWSLTEGDPVLFTDVNGDVHYYTVALVETLEPTAIEAMTAGEYALSLFTCTVGGRYRVTVRCQQE